MSDTTTEPLTRGFQVFPCTDEPDRRLRYRWRLRTADGKVCLLSHTGFTVKADAHADAEKVKAAASQAPIEDVTD